MQYFKPEAPFFVGDCMPFYHEGTFHLYYLVDENHHQAKGGLGGHQWAHASSYDLIHWEHHPIAIPCTEDWEGSICTGSTFYHQGKFYGFYATRLLDRTEKLSLAVSSDGIAFQKTVPNPFAGPPAGFRAQHYRDPFVFADESTGEFHMLVTAALEDFPLHGRGGCLLRLTSKDLHHWEVAEPFLVPGGKPGHASIPECPDFFFWNGWYYLVFSLEGVAHYRMSRQMFGPWLRPPVDTFDGSALASVMKTASFANNRRIGVAFLNARRDDKDDGERLYAGNAVFREIFQHADGSLGTKFPAEMTPKCSTALDLLTVPLTPGASCSVGSVDLNAVEGLEVAAFDAVPQNIRLTLNVEPMGNCADFGLWLRGSGRYETGYPLHFLPYERKVTLNGQAITCMDGLDRPFSLEIIVKDDIIDVCVDQRRCVINRCPELKGERVFFFCRNGHVRFSSVTIAPLLPG
jgi:hypothetical protein